MTLSKSWLDQVLGISPFFNASYPTLTQEAIARWLGTTAFVQEASREAAYHNRQGRRIAAAAILEEAEAHIHRLEALDGLGESQEASTENEPEPPGEFSITNAMKTMAASTQLIARVSQPFKEEISRISEIDNLADSPYTAYPAAIAAIMAHCAALRFHIRQIQEIREINPQTLFQGEGHNLAACASTATIEDLMAYMDELADNHRPTVPKSLINRTMRTAREALAEMAGSGRDRVFFTPIIFHESLKEDLPLQKEGREAARELITENEQPFIIKAPAQVNQPHDALVAYWVGETVQVKRFTDEYHEETTCEEAVDHADAMLELIQDNGQEDGGDSPQKLEEAAVHLSKLAMLDLHTVAQYEFQEFLGQLRQNCKDPHMFNEAAHTVLTKEKAFEHDTCGEVLQNILEQANIPTPEMATPEQAAAVLRAAKESRMAQGPLQTLALALNRSQGEKRRNKG